MERDLEAEMLQNYDSIRTIVDEDISLNMDKITDNDFAEIVNQILHQPNQVNVIMFWSPWVTKSHKTISFAQRAM